MTNNQWISPDLTKVRRSVEQAVRDIESLEAEITGSQDEYETGARIVRGDYWGMRAATRKRLAEVQFLADEPREQWEQTLRAVYEDYRKALGQGLQVDHWVAGQYLVMRSVLQIAPDKEFDFWWEEATRIALGAVRTGDATDKMWAHSTFADLCMVGLAEGRLVSNEGRIDLGDALDPLGIRIKGEKDVSDHLKLMVDEGGGPKTCRAIWPTFRQFWRWRYWWTHRSEWATAAEMGYQYLWKLIEPRLDPTASATGTQATAGLVTLNAT